MSATAGAGAGVGSGVTAGPSYRLLAGFRSLATAWLAGDRAAVEIHGGRFDGEELLRFRGSAPFVRAGCLAVASAKEDGGGAVLLDLRLAAAVTGRRTAKGEPSGAQARRMAERLCFELGRFQAWPRACFSEAELDPARTDLPRGRDVGDPRGIRAANLYSGKIDAKGVALWAVTWTQQFRAIATDFALPLPAPAGIPDTVLSGRAPDIGSGHEGDYETVVAPEAEGA